MSDKCEIFWLTVQTNMANRCFQRALLTEIDLDINFAGVDTFALLFYYNQPISG